MSGEITGEMERFIHDHIHSIEQLEILLLLAGAPRKDWTAQEVSQKLYRQVNSVSVRLEELRGQGLLAVRQENGPLYRYASHVRYDSLIQALERAYQVRKDAVIQTVFAKPPESLRAFSNAFRIRRED